MVLVKDKAKSKSENNKILTFNKKKGRQLNIVTYFEIRKL